MLSFSQLTPAQAKQIRYVLCDIDDTITTHGKLPAASYAALWALEEAGIGVIPVTGRPAGWCDLIVRQWPVKAVVGENGAFVNYFEDEHLQTFTHPSVAEDPAPLLAKVRDAALQAVPGCRVAKDQFSRRYDVAIDFREDPPYLGFEEAEKIRQVCASLGAEAKVSSIHVNAWFGSYDKVSMTQLFFKEVLGIEDPRECVIFFGDSPNDEPMFRYFPLCCAVANIKPFVDKLQHLPTFVADKEGGEGFAESVQQILKMRAK